MSILGWLGLPGQGNYKETGLRGGLMLGMHPDWEARRILSRNLAFR